MTWVREEVKKLIEEFEKSGWSTGLACQCRSSLNFGKNAQKPCWNAKERFNRILKKRREIKIKVNLC